ncbi:hypothetical protein PMIN01_04277 [Paraphaeosphaeria minitans]|uniref:Apple domain-containing protein n=1 Tax=Paraphaeosphaeria minitans TaxID=565426 RepID=A0A9P6GJZ8_9PLEO|nr:hypothetical protein PMIN01_04277 [Paraphaeosphaeria minitans]
MSVLHRLLLSLTWITLGALVGQVEAAQICGDVGTHSAKGTTFYMGNFFFKAPSTFPLCADFCKKDYPRCKSFRYSYYSDAGAQYCEFFPEFLETFFISDNTQPYYYYDVDCAFPSYAVAETLTQLTTATIALSTTTSVSVNTTTTTLLSTSTTTITTTNTALATATRFATSISTSTLLIPTTQRFTALSTSTVLVPTTQRLTSVSTLVVPSIQRITIISTIIRPTTQTLVQTNLDHYNNLYQRKRKGSDVHIPDDYHGSPTDIRHTDDNNNRYNLVKFFPSLVPSNVASLS